MIGTTTIICDTCQKKLRKGDSGKIEYKTCIQCVQSTSKRADPFGIKKPLTMSDQLDAVVQKEANKKRAKNKDISVDIDTSILVQNGKVLFGLNFTLGKLKKFDMAFSKEQLLAFIEDIERVEKDEILE